MDFETSFKASPEKSTVPCAYRGVTKFGGGNKFIANDSLFPLSKGWHRYDAKTRGTTVARTRFDVDKNVQFDAFCASVALAVQRLTPEERKALRENNEAWWLDAMLGNKRNRPVSIVHTEPASAEPSAPAVLESIHPIILSQSWDSRTRTGSVVFKVADRAALDEGVAWLRDEYLPEYCQTLGVTVSVDSPAGTPAADIRIDGIEPVTDGASRLKFRLEK